MILPGQHKYAVDVSVWQNPSILELCREKVDAVFIRAAYGARPDNRTLAHVKIARTLGVPIGLYSFFRVVEDVSAQFEVLASQCEAAGIGNGDIVPTLDVEDDGAASPLLPNCSAPAATFMAKIVSTWGDGIVYTSEREWLMLGRPLWVLSRSQWIAHYTSAPTPMTPNDLVPMAWQHLVGEFDPTAPGGERDRAPFPGPYIDQSRIYLPLPIIGQKRSSQSQMLQAVTVGGITDSDRAKVDAENALSIEQQARDYVKQIEPDKLP